MLRLALALLLPLTSLAAEPPLLTPETVTRTARAELPVSDAIRHLRTALDRGRENVRGQYSFAFRDLFLAACPHATAPELAELALLLDRLPQFDVEFLPSFNAWAQAHVRLATTKLQARPPQLDLPPSPAPPVNLATLPPEIPRAWATYQSATAPYRALLPPPEPPAKNGFGPASFFDQVGTEKKLHALLANPKDEVWKDLLTLREQLSPVIGGDSSPQFLNSARWAVLMALCGREQYREALGASLELNWLTYLFPPAPPASLALGDHTPALSSFLKASGLDWESLLLGHLCADLFPPAPAPWWQPSRLPELWQLLAAHGSADSIRLALSLRDRLPPEQVLAFLVLAAGPVPEPPPSGFSSSTPVLPLRRTARLAEPARAEVLTALTAQLAGSAKLEALKLALDTIPAALAPELEAPLRALLPHRSHPIAAAARKLLVDAHLADAQIPITPAPPDLRFRLTDGKPITGVLVQFFTPGERGDYSTHPDSDGLARRSLEHELRPETLHSFRVLVQPNYVHVPEVKKGPAPENATWPGPWIDTAARFTVGEDREIPVTIKTAALEATFKASDKIPTEAEIEVQLTRLGEPTGAELQKATLRVSAHGTATFARLQTGTYQLAVTGDHLADFTSKPIVLGTAGALRLIPLEPAHQLTGLLLLPSGAEQPLDYQFRLTQSGRAGPIPVDRWTRLPSGKYHLHLPSTAALEASQRQFGFEVPATPSTARHRGLEYDFEITPDSPLTIDLGPLKPKPE